METEKIDNRKLIKEGLEKLSLSPFSSLIDKFLKYLELLIEWNKKINLSGIKDPSEIIIKHFFDSITCLCAIEGSKNQKVIDIGAGAGLPGIAVKLCMPDIKLTLVESTRKKTDFLRLLSKELYISDIEIINDRAENLARMANYREKFDYVLVRALGHLSVVIELCSPFLRLNGKIIAQKSLKADKEIRESHKALNALNCKIEKVLGINVPFLDSKRVIILIEKLSSTSSFYPRKPGIPQKDPIL